MCHRFHRRPFATPSSPQTYGPTTSTDVAVSSVKDKRTTVRVAGKVNLYLVAFAGDGNENVFRNEVEYVEKQFVERFDAAGHTLGQIARELNANGVPTAQAGRQWWPSTIRAVLTRAGRN